MVAAHFMKVGSAYGTRTREADSKLIDEDTLDQ